MKFFRYLLPIATASCGVVASTVFAYADNETFHNETLDRDFEAVQEYVNSKRTIPLEEKDCNLSISGDIRFDWAHIIEKLNCRRLRGDGGVVQDVSSNTTTAAMECATAIPTEVTQGATRGVPYSTDVFDIEFNLYFDYVCDRAWGVVWLQFDNIAGTEKSHLSTSQDPEGCFGSGTCDDLCLKKAYMGYNICADGESRFDIEVGRRPLYTVFDSRIQFQSRFDGILLKYAHNFECYADTYFNIGGFVIDERVYHFGYVLEVGALNIMDCGFDFKYSFIDWQKHGVNRAHRRDPRGCDFKNSQWTFAYNFDAEMLCVPAKLYGAVLVNHTAEKTTYTNHKKENLAWYIGFILGQVCCEGDWAFDINYQYVEAQAIPDHDVSGIDRGNVLGNTFTQGTSASDSRGRANYKGWRLEGLYALTDNLSIDASVEWSKAADKRIGGKHSYSKFELEAIYAF